MNTPRRKKLWILLALVAAVPVAAVLALDVFHAFSVNMPEVAAVDPAHRDDLLEKQGWTRGWGVKPLTQAQWFHHTPQGTIILPYDWFVALERPEVTLLSRPGRFVEGDYLQRFGFLPSERDPGMNPDNLPIGFAKDDHFRDPTHPGVPPYRAVGLTCAACHTGEIHYQGVGGDLRAVRVEGAPAMIHTAEFQKAVGLALAFTDRLPTRFQRFADRVLGPKKGDAAARATLRSDLRSFIKLKQEEQSYAEKKNLNPLDPGFSRTDALGRIGNRVFGPLDQENLTVADAPVNFPHLWGTPWFDWVQYNASIRMPMVRNIGEALGVGAVVNIAEADSKNWYASTVNVVGLHMMESQLGGNQPFEGLRAPRWADTGLPAIDPARAERGAGLYRKFCQSCHLPPVDELKADLARDDPAHWQTESERGGKKYRVLKLQKSDLQLIGTDPNQAINFYRRLAYVNGKTVSASKGLYNVTGFVRQKFYRENGLDAARAFEFDRFRPFDDAKIQEGKYNLDDEGVISKTIVPRLAYKARPLDGIWATAPFFHNGSVPNLYEVLLPAAERSASFYLGTKRLDPERVGFVTGRLPGGFLLNTALSGNRNTGHEFRNMTLVELEQARGITPPPARRGSEDDRWARVLGLAPTAWRPLPPGERRAKVRHATWSLLRERGFVMKGLIGPGLTEAERWDLVEYLKSL